MSGPTARYARGTTTTGASNFGGYGSMIMAGITAIQAYADIEHSNAAAYNEAYANANSKLNIAESKHIAQLNIAAIAQDKVLTNTSIRMKQDQAEAMTKVNAAAAGVSGGSVEDVLYSTEVNASLATSRASRQADQATAQQQSMIVSQQSALLGVNDDPEASYAGVLLDAFNSFSLSSVKVAESLDSNDFTLSSLWSG